MTDKILVLTDIGSDIDDALSLLTMINAGLNIEGVYVTNGDLNSRASIAREMLNRAGKEHIEVGVGTITPITPYCHPYKHFDQCKYGLDPL